MTLAAGSSRVDSSSDHHDAEAQARIWRLGLGFAALGAVLFSGKAILVKLAYRYGVDPTTLIALRMAYALPWFVLIAWWDQRRRVQARVASSAWMPSARSAVADSNGSPAALAAPPIADHLQPLSRRDGLKIIGVGLLGYYMASYLDFLGLQYITAGFERVILYLNPTLVLLMSVVLFKQALVRRQLLALAISYAGVLLVFYHDLQVEQGQQVALGAALVFASAVSYALYLIFSGELVKRIGTIRLTALASTVACLACIAQFLVLNPLAALAQPWQVHALSLLNATACTVLPVFLVMLAIARVGPSVTSQTGMIGPVSTLTLAWWFLGESVSATQLFGTAVVVAGVALLSRR